MTTYLTLEGRRTIPEDMAEWFTQRQLISLALEALQEVPWPASFPSTSPLSHTPAPVLRTLCLYSYARGIFCSFDLEALCKRDQIYRYICAGSFPMADELRAFRRAHFANLRDSLAELVRTAIQLQPSQEGQVEPDLFHNACAEANRRLKLAMRADSIALDT